MNWAYARRVMTSQAALCSLCRHGNPNPICPACKDLRETQGLLAAPHYALGLAPVSTLALLDWRPGTVVFERRREAALGFFFIFIGIFVIAIMGIVFNASGLETLPFAIPLSLISLVGVFYGIRWLRYRQTISLERGTVTVTERGSKKAPITARDIRQLIVHARHKTHWHKGLRWHAIYELHAHTSSGDIVVLSGGHEEVRFVEASFENVLGIADDPSRNTVTTV